MKSLRGTSFGAAKEKIKKARYQEKWEGKRGREKAKPDRWFNKKRGNPKKQQPKKKTTSSKAQEPKHVGSL